VLSGCSEAQFQLVLRAVQSTIRVLTLPYRNAPARLLRRLKSNHFHGLAFLLPQAILFHSGQRPPEHPVHTNSVAFLQCPFERVELTTAKKKKKRKKLHECPVQGRGELITGMGSTM